MNKKSTRYRLYEMIPGIVAWFVIFFPIWGSFLLPKAVAYFVIAFLVYWLYQSFKSALFAIRGYFLIISSQKTNWLLQFNQDFRANWLIYRDIQHVVIISSYREPIAVIEMAFSSLASQIDIDLNKINVILAQEARAGHDSNRATLNYFNNKYKNVFGSLIFTSHPSDTIGEIAGKHSNEAFAAKYFKKKFLDIENCKLKIENCTLTSCDVDTIFNPKYFSALTYNFAKNPERYYRFWQSPIFWHHNINNVPAPTRIIGTMGNVIHLANIQEPDGLFFNYSCYSSSYCLIDSAGYWDPDMISEDWHIFLQSFFVSGGRASVEPIFLPTIADAPSGTNYFNALKNRYNQCLRHAWGAIDIPYALEQSRLHPEIPLLTRLMRIFKLIQTHFIWSSNWFILTLGTSLPVLLNPHFFNTSLGYNLPRISNIILTICLLPLSVLIVLDWKLRPTSQKKGFKNIFQNIIQWPLMPLATLVLSVLPGLHSHTRLLFGQGLEYKTTVKKVTN
ncbi:hypothetical protein COZ41_02815 [Candidatus Shapirobacteria bacterium CG_4_10_14_3_um_filter_35_13]|uniref:Glycosyltransferase 2-like domain-containing protein n=1 Tax=Candidatus Shapirobacteria bacterium CG_4_10_14_3_um_filter_35_13 TaxID=1974873 RepID=A0A2M7LIG3_9BACT|nr:MAG: hypothetical protein COZ41_02815 [Candidatus Shapirobacteria bacterium CG_4_10_14_3_um_filter_35_13]